jgi:hypothetical protein
LGNRTVYGGGSEEVKEVKEVEECKLLVGGDSKEVPLTEGCGADRLECREGVFLLA